MGKKIVIALIGGLIALLIIVAGEVIAEQISNSYNHFPQSSVDNF